MFQVIEINREIEDLTPKKLEKRVKAKKRMTLKY